MKTPAEYTKNLKDGIVTTEMMRDALYSVNKRAKNHRDREREYRHAYGKYALRNEEKSREEKLAMYGWKELLLSFLEPVCIHREFGGFERVRVYDYEESFEALYLEMYLKDRIVWSNSYYDWDTMQEVWFFDYETDESRYRYYLYYICADHTFHTPIDEAEVTRYALDVKDIGTLETYGREIGTLLSMQFVKKLAEALESGAASYQKTLPDAPPEYADPVLPNPHLSGPILEERIYNMVKRNGERIERMLFAQTEVPFDGKELRADAVIDQKKKRKKEAFSSPNVTLDPKVKRPGTVLRQYEMLGFLRERLEAYTGDSMYTYFLESCMAKDSPVYEELTACAARRVAASQERAKMQREAMQLYKQDKTRPIINDNGVVRFASA
jgi:hypothetical protein